MSRAVIVYDELFDVVDPRREMLLLKLCDMSKRYKCKSKKF